MMALGHDAWGKLVLTDSTGEQHVGVEPVRAFPLSDPNHGVALVGPDGREVAWIDDLDGLPASVRRVLEQELARREFVPVLRRVLRISAPAEPSEWTVETDRGPTRFVLNSEEDVHRLDGGRALITDSHGIRYLIPDLAALDVRTRRLLERYV